MTFAYHRSIAPMMWVFVAIASVELVVVHLLVALWRPWVAVILSALSLATIAWLVAAIRSFTTMPVVIDRGRIRLRAGRLKGVEVGLGNVRGLRSSWDAAALRQRGVLNLALIAYPNVVIDLWDPVRSGRRAVSTVAHRLDDPAAFVRAIEGLGLRDGE